MPGPVLAISHTPHLTLQKTAGVSHDPHFTDKESLKYAAVYNVWKKAFINMVNNKKIISKAR